jgi:hypothetical protein
MANTQAVKKLRAVRKHFKVMWFSAVYELSIDFSA